MGVPCEQAPLTAEEVGLFPAPKEPEEFGNLPCSVCGGGYVDRLLEQSSIK
jgi:hypothetical protein